MLLLCIMERNVVYKSLHGIFPLTLTGQIKWTFASSLTHQVKGTVLEYKKDYINKKHSLHNSVASSNLCLNDEFINYEKHTIAHINNSL